ncbi:thiamine pyridinylase [Burkholderia cepacia]|uniref:thiamine pyridinylase n=1 Tax=Burkholderia cepacia TaxID=292 RepID=UPI0009BAA881|nr:thiamine pyridinylase [Burkholderia cepacia]
MSRLPYRFILLLGLCLGILSQAFADTAAPRQLTIALYPWVPRVEQFQKAIEKEWKKVQPKVELVFVSADDWDGGYTKEPPANADVYVYDAIFFDYFRSRNWLEPLAAKEVQNIDDYVPYAIKGVKVGERYYSLPQLGCANILFYRKSDKELAAAKTLAQVRSALDQCTYTSEVPPDKRGLMIDMSGSVNNSLLYLDAAHSWNGAYPLSLPWSLGDLNSDAVGSTRSLLAMASFKNAMTSLSGQYDRAVWFSNGEGRAVIAYSESMSAMSEQARQNIDFKFMPLSDRGQSQLFYADVIGVNTSTNLRGTRMLAVQLANVVASSSTMLASIGPDASAVPQYLFATRRSVLTTLARSYPLYGKMNALLNAGNPVMFKLDAQARNWFASMNSVIQQQTQSSYVCGCDIETARPIHNYRDAQAICPTVCAAQGGWNRQWTNRQPAASAGKSACGCNACPTTPAEYSTRTRAQIRQQPEHEFVSDR